MKSQLCVLPLLLVFLDGCATAPETKASVALLDNGNVLKTSSNTRIAATLLELAIGVGICLLSSGCIGLDPAHESDWHWKQFNPEYRSPYPEDPRPFRSGIF